MEKRIRTVTLTDYMAFDGECFETESECLAHENKINAEGNLFMWDDSGEELKGRYGIQEAIYVKCMNIAAARYFHKTAGDIGVASVLDDYDAEKLTYPAMFTYDGKGFLYWAEERKRLLDEIKKTDKIFDFRMVIQTKE